MVIQALTFTDINLSATITPKYATSKILVCLILLMQQTLVVLWFLSKVNKNMVEFCIWIEVSTSPWLSHASAAGQMIQHQNYGYSIVLQMQQPTKCNLQMVLVVVMFQIYG